MDLLLERVKAIRQHGVIAGEDLRIAQHRDTKRYAVVRSGVYHPRMRKYDVGDYVYCKHNKPTSTLDTFHYDNILRVAAILESGNLMIDRGAWEDNICRCD